MGNHSTTAEIEMFIEDSDQDKEEDLSFYRSFDNREEYHRFRNLTKNPVEFVKEPEAEYYGEDDMPELFDPGNREDVTFNSFESDRDKADLFLKSLLCFSEVENHFFYAVIYGLLFDKLDGAYEKLENTKEILGDIFFNKLMQIEPAVMLDHFIFGYFEHCSLINEILSEHNYFLRFYERRIKFRYQLRQELKTKNEMRKELSACPIKKFNVFELLRNHLNNGKRQHFISIDIVYESTLDTTKSIFCFFALSISLGFHTSFEKNRGGKRYISHTGARQCH